MKTKLSEVFKVQEGPFSPSAGGNPPHLQAHSLTQAITQLLSQEGIKVSFELGRKIDATLEKELAASQKLAGSTGGGQT